MNKKEKIKEIVYRNLKLDTEEFKNLSLEEQEKKQKIASNSIKLFLNHWELFEELAK
nr:hypothetical protein [Fusobacterium gastrosuis]